jgi:hypothetical protein
MTPAERGNAIDQLVTWISQMGKKGYFPRSTVANRIRAIRNVEAILEDDEKKSLDTLLAKVDSVVDRWATLTNAVPTSIQPTKSHLRGLIQDYVRYQQSPGAFTRGQGTPRPKKASTSKAKTSTPKTKKAPPVPDEKVDLSKGKAPAININIQINIPTDAPDAQIDKIFASMAKHIYKKPTE